MWKKIIREDAALFVPTKPAVGATPNWRAKTFQQEMNELVQRFTFQMGKYEHLIATLSELSVVVSTGSDINSIMEYVIENAKRNLRANAGTFFIVEGNNLKFNIVSGGKDELSSDIMPINEKSIVGWVAVHREPLIVNDPYGDPRFDRRFDERTGYRTRSIICVPIIYNEILYGCLELINKVAGEGDCQYHPEFDDEDLRYLQLFAAIAAIAIDNRNNVEQIAKSSAIQTAVNMIQMHESKFPYTTGHSERVKNYSRAIGRLLGLDPAVMNLLSDTAQLHDIGMISIPDSIITSQENTTETAEALLQHISKIPRHLFSVCPSIKLCLPGIVFHHEWWDGRGSYKKKEREIPQIARIIAIADFIDIHVSGRPYLQPVSLGRAFEQVITMAGTQLDPVYIEMLIHKYADNYADKARQEQLDHFVSSYKTKVKRGEKTTEALFLLIKTHNDQRQYLSQGPLFSDELVERLLLGE
ncbi:MAG: HD domain-containing phosphohydrolase [Candidatus Margulisiibacteriota bacterium]